MVGPEGQTVDDAVILTRSQIDPINLMWQDHDFVHARDGRFELHGFDPEKPTPVYFLDAEHEWGAAVELSGKQAGEDLTVRLQPCGQAKARFVGPDGKPLAKLAVWPYLQLLMTPGAVQGIYRRPWASNWRPTGRTCPTSTPSTTGRTWSPTPTAASPCPP